MFATPPALLLHGQPGGAGDWKWVIEELAGRVQTIPMQRPGYDGTPAGGVRHSAVAALATLDAAGIDRAVIVGHSYGGAVAAWIAAFHPERVAGLVLVSAAANDASLVPGDRLLAARFVGPVASAGLLWGTGIATQLPGIRRHIAWAAQLPPEYLIAEGRRSLRLSTLRTFLIEQRLLLAELPLLEARLGSITAPTRVLVGSHDTFVPPHAGRTLATQIPEAELIEMPRAGHVLNVQHPGMVADAIIRAVALGPVNQHSPARPPAQ